MAKSKKNIAKQIKAELGITNVRSTDWVGIRPTVYQTDKKNPKKDRRKTKIMLKSYDW